MRTSAFVAGSLTTWMRRPRSVSRSAAPAMAGTQRLAATSPNTTAFLLMTSPCPAPAGRRRPFDESESIDASAVFRTTRRVAHGCPAVGDLLHCSLPGEIAHRAQTGIVWWLGVVRRRLVVQVSLECVVADVQHIARAPLVSAAALEHEPDVPAAPGPVSYTHLTLP